MLKTPSLTEQAYRWFKTTWLGTGKTELSSLDGTLFRMTFSRCGGRLGGGSFDTEELDAKSLEEEVEAMLE